MLFANVWVCILSDLHPIRSCDSDLGPIWSYDSSLGPIRSHDHKENNTTCPWIPALDTNRMADRVKSVCFFFQVLITNITGI